ncbi:alpha/beta hydrolase [Bradyrhizobium sp. OAE829]|uniref:alpha/beta fold hydrolase n=1 Tax=Bradyrhizobium sp. OAE829 TaxID=2663807 RepID=UPI00178B428B
MKLRHELLASLLASSLQLGSAAAAPPAGSVPARTVVLVHGAFADGSSWNKVIPLLEKAGLKVVAVQNPLDSLASDVAATNRAIANEEGPVVLVGHSWGGAVITEAGVNEKDRSLVYVAAYAPKEGQSVLDTVKSYPQIPGRAFFVKEDAGHVKISDEGIFKHFAAGLPRPEQQLVAATQGPLNGAALGQPVSHPAWTKTPSFFVVAGNDTIISPQLERDEAKRMNAVTVEVPSSHVAMLTYPKVVADLIIKAAR